MAKNPKPLTILIADDLAYAKPIQALAAKGHDVVTMKQAMSEGREITAFDIIFSPKAWRMTEDLANTAKLPDIAVSAARAVKYKRKKKGGDDDEAPSLPGFGHDGS